MRKRILFFFLCSTHLLFSFTLYAQMDDCSAHPDDMVMHDEHCAVFALVPEDGASHVSVNNGSWFSPSTWNTGTVPGAGATVLIDALHTVTYNGSSELPIWTLRVNGTLTFSADINTKLVVSTFVVDPNGHLNIGTLDAPVAADVQAEIMFPDQGPINTDWDPFQFSKGLVSHGYTSMNGAYKKAIISLSGNHNSGKNFLKLSETPTGWQTGDRILVPGVKTDPAGSHIDNSRYQDEILIITSIVGNNIYFTHEESGGDQLLYDHIPPAGFGLKVFAGNLTRNVRIYAENGDALPSDQRGHLMLMHKPTQQMAYCQLTGLGRSDKGYLVDDAVVDDMGMVVSPGTNPRGRYSCHVHRAGKHDYAGMPVTITGCVVDGTPGWAFVNHSSHVDMTDNIAYNFKGAAFITEAGDELGSFTHNMAVKGIGLDADDYTIAIDRLVHFDLGIDGDGFWMKGSNLSLVNNIAASCHGIGFNYFSDDDDFTPDRRVKIPKEALPYPVITGPSDSTYSGITPVRQNTGSVAYNTFGGLSFWTHMYNSDNIGDFSRNEYSQLSHNAVSTVENFSFWNCRSQGISLSYSSQIALKNGILLGDLENYFLNPADGTLTSENAGQGITSNGVTGQVLIENCTVAGWQKACVALRTDNLVSGDGLEYNYKLSSLRNNQFSQNVVSLVPETGQDEYYTPDYEQFPEYLVLTGDNSFSTLGTDLAPLADFSHAPAGGFGIRFLGTLSSDPDPVVTNAGNGIAAYRWDFGDGQTGFGADPLHVYEGPGTYIVTLTVYDCLGQTAVKERTLEVSESEYANQVLESGMEQAFLPVWNSSNSTNLITDKGWGASVDWSLENGKAVIYKSNQTRYLLQLVRNDSLLRGIIPFSIQAKNLGLGATGNSLKVEITGINGELKDDNPAIPNHVFSWNHADADFSKTVLLNSEIGLDTYNWQTFMEEVDFGNGYQYLQIKVYSEGVQMSKEDVQGIDNICLPCSCELPVGMMEDMLTSTSATLIWDNVGALDYEVKVRQKGLPWTTYEVSNTYLDLNDLVANKRYQWQVRVNCSGSWTGWSQVQNFMTPVSGSLCTSPVSLVTDYTTESGALVHWNSVPGALSYQVGYRKSSGGAWTNITLSDTSFQMSGLLPSTAYTWRVRAQCTEGWKPFLNMEFFTTLSARYGETTALSDQTSLLVYPNPASQYLTLEMDGSQATFAKISDLNGKTVWQENVPGNDGHLTWTIPLDGLQSGLFILQVFEADGEKTSITFMHE